MRQFISNLVKGKGSVPIQKYVPITKIHNTIISGQSIAQGQYGLSQSGYSNEKIFNTNAEYLECKTETHVWQTFRDEMMSPWQYREDYSWGCGMEYSLAEHFNNAGYQLNVYKPAYGGKTFGTDTNVGDFHVSADLQTTRWLTTHILLRMEEQKALGINFDSFLWLHGESDGRDALDSRNAYETNLRRFIAKIRTVEANIPFLIRKLPIETETWMGAVIAGGRDAINTAIDNVIADTANCYLVEMPNPFSQGDTIHPSNPTGNDQMALAYWNKLQTLF